MGCGVGCGVWGVGVRWGGVGWGVECGVGCEVWSVRCGV